MNCSRLLISSVTLKFASKSCMMPKLLLMTHCLGMSLSVFGSTLSRQIKSVEGLDCTTVENSDTMSLDAICSRVVHPTA